MWEDFVHGDAGEPALEVAFQDRVGYFLAGGVGVGHGGWWVSSEWLT